MKLNLGCGKKVLEGYINIDAVDRPGVVVRNLLDLDYEEGSIAEVLASDILEHFAFGEACKLLLAWCTFLRPGGKLVVSTTDIDRIYQGPRQAAAMTDTVDGYEYLSKVVFGHDKQYDQHKSVWTVSAIYWLLSEYGMVDISHRPRGGWCMCYTSIKGE